MEITAIILARYLVIGERELAVDLLNRFLVLPGCCRVFKTNVNQTGLGQLVRLDRLGSNGARLTSVGQRSAGKREGGAPKLAGQTGRELCCGAELRLALMMTVVVMAREDIGPGLLGAGSAVVLSQQRGRRTVV